jgi:hypothetical protein
MTRPLRSARITRHHRYYETIRPCAPPPVLNPSRLTTSWSAPSRPDWPPGTLSERQVPAFPCRSPNQARATYMPDTTWAVNRYPPDSSQRQDQPPVLMPSELSTLQRWFARARLLDPYLTRSRRAVSASLTTPALNRRSMRWFEATPCRAAPEDLPPSPAQLLASAEPDLHRLLPPAHAAHDLVVYCGDHGVVAADRCPSYEDLAVENGELRALVERLAGRWMRWNWRMPS